MKTIYKMKSLFPFAVLFGFAVTLSAQTPKEAEFVERTDLVKVGEDEYEPFVFLYETGAAWGDYNNDGYLDLLCIGAGHNNVLTAVLYKNHEGKYFTKEEHPFPGLRAATVNWLDYDNDGNLDVFIAGKDSNDGNIGKVTKLFRNLGAEENFDFEEVCEGEFIYMDHEGNNKSNRYVAVGDFNNDGWVDIYMHGQDENNTNRWAVLYRNVEGLYFSEVRHPVDGDKPLVQLNGASAQFGDYNNDGYLDLIAMGWSIGVEEYESRYGTDFGYGWMGRAVIYKNNGDGTFEIANYVPGCDSGDALWFDYDNDGMLDIVFTSYAWDDAGLGTTGGHRGDLYHNDGNDEFTWYKSGETGLQAQQDHSMATGDVNNDGYEDILFMKGNPDCVYLNNYGDGTFTKYPFSYGFEQRGGTVCLVDFDRDGDLDAYLAAYADIENHFARFMENKLSENIPVNEAPSVPTNLKLEEDGDGYLFSWDASTDDLTPSEAIKYNLFIKQEDVIKMILPADLETGLLKVNDNLAPLTTTFYKMNKLEGEFTWGVQAIDGAKLTSKFAKANSDGTSIQNIVLSNIGIVYMNKSIKIKTNNTLFGTISVYTVDGKTIFAKSGQINNTVINLSTGMYVVKITSNEGIKTEKVVIK